MSRFSTPRRSWLRAALALGVLLGSAQLVQAQAFRGTVGGLGQTTLRRQAAPPLNNGSLQLSIDPRGPLNQAGNPVLPGLKSGISTVASLPQDLRLVCNGIAIPPGRLIAALEGHPAGSAPLVITNTAYGPCIAAVLASGNFQNIAICGQPIIVINVGTGVSAPLGSINVRPFFPFDDTIYQICGWGGKRRPRPAEFFSPLDQGLTQLPPVPASITGCCGSSLGLPTQVPVAARPGYYAFPVSRPGYANTAAVYNYFNYVAGQVPFFGHSSHNQVVGNAAYSSFGGDTLPPESQPAETEETKDPSAEPAKAEDKTDDSQGK